MGAANMTHRKTLYASNILSAVSMVDWNDELDI
jgi:hypothetical protein